MMKKMVCVSLLMAFALLIGTIPISAGGAVETEKVVQEEQFPKMTLRFGSTSAENTVIVSTMKKFAQKVSDKTNGQVTVMIFPASQLGGVPEMSRNAQLGALDMCMTQPANLADMGIKEMSTLVLPYIFKSYDQRWDILFGDVGSDLLDKVSEGGIKLKGFGYFPDGARNFFTVKGKPIRKIEDMKGLKLRVQPYALDTDMVIALGASPTPTAFSELYSALQTGLVDGAEQPIAGYYGGKYYEVTSYLTLDEHTYNTLIVLFSEIIWNKLSPQLQAVLIESWEEAVEEARSVVLQNEADILNKLTDYGIEVIKLTDREKWVAAMEKVYAKHAIGLENWIERFNAVE